MDDFDIADLAEDIKANGLLEPIVLYEGMILDGRNRHAACLLAVVEPKFAEANGIGSPVLYVVSKNLHRRHLTVSQRAAIAAEVAESLRPEAQERLKAGRLKGGLVASGSLAKTPTTRTGGVHVLAAKELGVGQKTVQSAMKVRKADPELHEKVKAGTIPLADAERIIAGEPAKSKRQESIENAHTSRMIGALSQIRGICVGLRSLNMKNLVLDNEERKLWKKTALHLSRELREFARNLGEEANGKENQ